MVTRGRASSWATEVLIREIASRSGIFGEASQILNNQERENSPFSLLIGYIRDLSSITPYSK